MEYYKHMTFNLVSHVEERPLNTIVTLQIVNTIGTKEEFIGYLDRIKALPKREEPANDFW